MEPEKLFWGVTPAEPSAPAVEKVALPVPKLPGEKRWHTRFECSGAASITPRGSQIPLHGVIKDVSQGGVYVETMSPLPVNSEVLLKVNIGGMTFEATGLVRTSYPMVGMGMSFRDVSQEDLQKLAAILPSIDAHAPEQPPSATVPKPQAPALPLDGYPPPLLPTPLPH